MKPTVGRTVRYHSAQGEAMAFVIKVHEKPELQAIGTVDLQVLLPDGTIKHEQMVAQGKSLGRWDWTPISK